MADLTRHLVFNFLDFLKDCIEDGTISPTHIPDVVQAMNSIGDAFDLDVNDPEQENKLSIKPAKLTDIFQVFLKLDMKAKQELSGKQQSSENKNTEPTSEDKAQAEEFKAKGNKCVTEGKFSEAIELYTKAIEINPKNPFYFANRAAANSQLGNHQQAIEDAQTAIKIDPHYSKAYSRLGHALYCTGKFKEALEAYEKASHIDPNNSSFQSAINTIKQRLNTTSASATSPDGSSTAHATASNDTNRSTAQSSASSTSGPNPNPGGFGGLEGLMNNPAIMNMANQFLSDPQRLNSLMSNPLFSQMARNFSQGSAGSGAGEDPLRGFMNNINNPDFQRRAQDFVQHTPSDGQPNPNSPASDSLSSLLNNPDIANLASQFMGNNNNPSDKNPPR